jgi:hypothetical protein
MVVAAREAVLDGAPARAGDVDAGAEWDRAGGGDGDALADADARGGDAVAPMSADAAVAKGRDREAAELGAVRGGSEREGEGEEEELHARGTRGDWLARGQRGESQLHGTKVELQSGCQSRRIPAPGRELQNIRIRFVAVFAWCGEGCGGG